MSIVCMLYFVAGALAIVSAAWGRVPLWVSVLLLCIAGLLSCFPLR